MYEHEGVLIQLFENRKAMQIKLASDNIDVRIRQVPLERANDTTGIDPEWLTAYDLTMNDWVHNDSTVWQWLKLKGLDEIGVTKRLSGLR